MRSVLLVTVGIGLLLGSAAVARADVIYDLSAEPGIVRDYEVSGYFVLADSALGSSTLTASMLLDWELTTDYGPGYTITAAGGPADGGLTFVSGVAIGDATIVSADVYSAIMNFPERTGTPDGPRFDWFADPLTVGGTISFDAPAPYETGGAEDIWHNYTLTLRTSAVPEPGTLALFGLGAGALALRRRRRKLA